MLLCVRCRTRGGYPSLTSTDAPPLSKQLFEMPLNIAVALTRGVFQAGTVKNGHAAVLVVDQASLLQNIGGDAHAGPADPQGRRMKSPCQKRHRPPLALSRTSVQHADPYQKGIKVTDAEMDSLSITRDDFHPEWNYTISPQTIDRAVIFA
jgi:hypothetical protein